LTLEEAKKAKEQCEDFAQQHLKLQLSHWHIKKVRKGLNFVGYKTLKTYKVVRKHSLYKFRKAAIKQKVVSIVSILGHSKKTKSLGYMLFMLQRYMPEYKTILPKRSYKCLNI
jgi:hypothetical protein